MHTIYTFEIVEQYIKKTVGDIYIDEKDSKFGSSVLDCIYKILNLTTKSFTKGFDGYTKTSVKQFRSLGDIYMLVCHHYKPVPLEEVFNALIEGVQKNMFGSWECEHINKRVYFNLNTWGTSKEGHTGFINGNTDEFGYDFTPFKIKDNSHVYGYQITATKIIEI